MFVFPRIVFCACLALFAPAAQSQPLFPNSIVSNDLEFITASDPHVFTCLTYVGRDRREMPDKRGGDLFADGTFVFTAQFSDGTRVGIWAHPDFGSIDRARDHVNLITEPLGKLPTVMRKNLSHVVLHTGDETAFGEDEGHFFVLYAENVKTRVRNHDIQETVFHESVHATLDADYARSSKWLKAQRADADFVTEYAANLPEREDMAESALFAYTMLKHPGRLPDDVAARVQKTMPNRLAFFRSLFIDSGPTFYKVGEPGGCG